MEVEGTGCPVPIVSCDLIVPQIDTGQQLRLLPVATVSARRPVEAPALVLVQRVQEQKALSGVKPGMAVREIGRLYQFEVPDVPGFPASMNV